MAASGPESPASHPQQATLFGHPCGLYVLFFAEMWERFSYYGMRALLIFYMLRGFLKYNDTDAYAIYGAYTALVYLTPFFGGLLADRILGARQAVILGGVLMAAGHLAMTVEHSVAFFGALSLLIVGNGFFKPNISAMVGSLYPEGSHKRDGGFTIFYMGINLGAAMSPLLCGYVADRFGWHYGFGLATIGMLLGLGTFVMPGRLARILTLASALASAVGLIVFRPSGLMLLGLNVFIAVSLLTAAVIAWVAAGRGGLPHDTGRPPSRDTYQRFAWLVYVGSLLSVGAFALLVSGFSVLTSDGKQVTIVPQATIQRLAESETAWVRAAAVVVQEVSKPAGLVLFAGGVAAFGFLIVETLRLRGVQRQRLVVVMILTFFSMLFWAFFEQAGSSINNFTDRNVDRVVADRRITQAEVGQTIRLEPTQEQLGYYNGDKLFTLDQLTALREQYNKEAEQARQRDKNANVPPLTISWHVVESNVGMGIAEYNDEIPASMFQAANPVFILLFGLTFTALWSFLAARGLEPSTPLKFALGLFQLGLGFAAMWYGAQTADARGMVAMGWLLLGYLLQTTGELCVSPVGLSMVTKLSPPRLVSTVMGTWFVATAFSQFLSAIIAQFTRVGGEEAEAVTIPPPSETVHIYGDVFGQIALAAIIASAVCLVLVPILKRMMHEDVVEEENE